MISPKLAATPWDNKTVGQWLESRLAAAKADQIAAERYDRARQDDCDKAAAEEMACSAVRAKKAIIDQASFIAALSGLLDRDDYIWRGVYNDARFDRHARSYIRKLLKMAKVNEGFGNMSRYQ